MTWQQFTDASFHMATQAHRSYFGDCQVSYLILCFTQSVKTILIYVLLSKYTLVKLSNLTFLIQFSYFIFYYFY